MDNKGKEKILFWGQVLFFIEALAYIILVAIYILGREENFNKYITSAEAITFGVLGILLIIAIPFLIFKFKFIISAVVPLRVLFLSYSLVNFNNITLISVAESVIFIYSIVYIYAYLTFKKG